MGSPGKATFGDLFARRKHLANANQHFQLALNMRQHSIGQTSGKGVRRGVAEDPPRGGASGSKSVDIKELQLHLTTIELQSKVLEHLSRQEGVHSEIVPMAPAERSPGIGMQQQLQPATLFGRTSAKNEVAACVSCVCVCMKGVVYVEGCVCVSCVCVCMRGVVYVRGCVCVSYVCVCMKGVVYVEGCVCVSCVCVCMRGVVYVEGCVCVSCVCVCVIGCVCCVCMKGVVYVRGCVCELCLCVRERCGVCERVCVLCVHERCGVMRGCVCELCLCVCERCACGRVSVV